MNATHEGPRTACTPAGRSAGGRGSGTAAAQLQGREARLAACMVTVAFKLCASSGASARDGRVWKSRECWARGDCARGLWVPLMPFTVFDSAESAADWCGARASTRRALHQDIGGSPARCQRRIAQSQLRSRVAERARAAHGDTMGH